MTSVPFQFERYIKFNPLRARTVTDPGDARRPSHCGGLMGAWPFSRRMRVAA